MPVIAVVTDLIFSTKITGTAKALGATVLVARSLEKLGEHLSATTADAHQPPLVIIDLNASGLDALEAVRTAKSHPAKPPVIAFLSHVQVDLAAQARQAGADEVLPRSAFVARLPELLKPS
jgi:CheY-like chemotaxis protein